MSNQGAYEDTTTPVPVPPVVGVVDIVSVHGCADGGPLRAVDVQAAVTAKCNGYKLYQNASSDYATLKANHIPIENVLVRIQHVTDRKVAAADYINDAGTGVFDLPLREATAAGVVWFELFNEVDQAVEGNGVAWDNFTEFCTLFNSTVALARKKYPTAKFLSPAISQQPGRFLWWDMFEDYGVFAVSDGLACHCYWDSTNGAYPMNADSDGRSYRALLKYLVGTQRIHITEASNNGAIDSDATKGQQYATYTRTLEPQIARVDFFCASSSDVGDGALFNARRETWVRGDVISAIVAEVAKR